VPDILAIVSKAIFENDALIRGELVDLGDVWPVDRYNSSAKGLTTLAEGGRIFLVTVRPPNEELWFLGVIDAPVFDGSAWIGRENRLPVTNIAALRGTIRFASGKGLSQSRGALGMSLQTARALAPASAAEILAVVGGARPRAAPGQAVIEAVGFEGSADDERRATAPAVVAAAPVPETAAAREIREKREAALEVELSRFFVLFDRMEEACGLRLPEHLAYGMGFLKGLLPEERAEIAGHVGRLIGIGTWFSGEDLPRAPGGNERLRDRAPDDPPELVPFLAVTPDAESQTEERWGLWYDDSNELPTGVARRTTRAGRGMTQLLGATFLTALRQRLAMPTGVYHASILGWLDDVLRREAADVRERSAIVLPRAGWILGERINPYVPDWDVPVDLMGELAQQGRAEAYAARAPVVEEWIDRARNELREGIPGRALFLGRELHAVHAAPHRFACTELLTRAYHALGRRALADTVRAVYRHEDPSAPIFEMPPPHPVIAAAASGELEEIAAALAEAETPTPDELEEALAVAANVKALDALLDHDASHVDSALWRRLRTMFRRSDKPREAAHHRALAMRLIHRGTVGVRTFERILRSHDEPLIRAATEQVDLEAHAADASGATPLHLAARAGAATVVRALLARGADPRTKNAAGRLAFDSAREAQLEAPNDPGISEIMSMLQMVGGGIAKPPLPVLDEVEYEEGDAVHHGKLGDGVVESVTGEGEEAKLKIRFEKETRTLLAKFVTRGG